jgi:hypothetical protein
MKLDLERTVTLGRLLELARGLASEEDENCEYDRALAELLTDAGGLPMDYTGVTLSAIYERRRGQ